LEGAVILLESLDVDDESRLDEFEVEFELEAPSFAGAGLAGFLLVTLTVAMKGIIHF
jgi:hypothetical protein